MFCRDTAEDYEKRDKAKPIDEHLTVSPAKLRTPKTDQLRGQRVIARKAEDGVYYSGK